MVSGCTDEDHVRAGYNEDQEVLRFDEKENKVIEEFEDVLE